LKKLPLAKNAPILTFPVRRELKGAKMIFIIYVTDRRKTYD